MWFKLESKPKPDSSCHGPHVLTQVFSFLPFGALVGLGDVDSTSIRQDTGTVIQHGKGTAVTESLTPKPIKKNPQTLESIKVCPAYRCHERRQYH